MGTSDRTSCGSARGVKASESCVPPRGTATTKPGARPHLRQDRERKPAQTGFFLKLVVNCLLLLLQALCAPASHISAQPAVRPLPAAPATQTPAPSQPSDEKKPETPPASESQPPPLDRDRRQIKETLEAIAKDGSLPEEVKNRCQEILTAAVKDLDRRNQAITETLQLREAAKSAAARKTQAENENARQLTIDRGGIEASSPAEDIAALLKRLEADLSTATARSKKLQEQLNNRRSESKELPQQIAEIEAKLASAKPPAVPDAEVVPLLAQAIAEAAAATKAAATAELELARQKLETYEVESSVLPLEKVQLDRLAAALTEAIGQVSGWASRRRQDEISTRITAFQAAAARDTSFDQAAAATTFELLERWPAFVAQLERWNGELLRLREASQELQSDYEKTESLLKADRATGSGLSRSAGSLLKRKRVMLSRTRGIFDGAAKQSAAIDAAQDMLADIDAQFDDGDVIDDDADTPAPAEQAPIEQQLRRLLEAMTTDVDRGLTDTLIPLGVQFNVLSRQIDDYDRLISKNLLWIRSEKPVRLADLPTVLRVAERFETARLRKVVRSLLDSMLSRPLITTGFFLASLIFIFLHRRFVVRLTALGNSVSGANAFRLWPTVQSLIYTVCAALPVWLPLAAGSWLLSEFAPAESTEANIAEAVFVAGLVFLPLEMLRQLIRPRGVAVAHFGWSRTVIDPLQRAVRRTAWLGLGLVFLARFLQLERSAHSEIVSLDRLVFTLLMAFVAILLWGLLDAKKGVTAALVTTRPGGALARLLWLWRPLVIAIPVLLAGLNLAGYVFAANQLAVSLYKSIWAVVGATVLQGFAMRWLLVSKRRIAVQQLKERSALKEQAEATGTTSDTLHVNQMKLADIDQQTRRLIDAVVFVGIAAVLLWVWSPILPALSLLDSVVLWQQVSADGSVMSVVTLNNVLIAIPTLIFTLILVQNAPGLLEAALLRRLPLDNATRYAITTLTSYVVAFCGFLLAAGTLGLRWSSVQWLAAGLSVGLGFGLQEVVANFVCGLILLFEQPIRVGDVVTLDSVSGVVSRIRIRATTVTTWERQEYVIPNKDLITGRVINWTLSDSVNRAELTVGVAYGSDTRRVIDLLRELCTGISEILNEPAPIITFEEFGDSTLNIVVRFYLASLDNRLGTISELHNQIHERFNTEGIEIAFPQVDIHMKPGPSA